MLPTHSLMRLFFRCDSETEPLNSSCVRGTLTIQVNTQKRVLYMNTTGPASSESVSAPQRKLSEWSNYPSLRRLSLACKFCGYISLGLAICLLALLFLQQIPMGFSFIPYLFISGLLLLALPEIIILAIRIEQRLASIDSKLK